MGCHPNITSDKFPKQGSFLFRRVRVVYHYGTDDKVHFGKVVRDDIEEPFRTIFALDDGRYIDAVECQYSLVAE